MSRSGSRTWFVTTLLALAAAACGDRGSLGPPNPPAVASAAPSGSSVVTLTPPARRAPLETRGSGVALTIDGDRAIVADEDHDCLYIVPVGFDDAKTVQVVPLPGPPAQVVALDGLVLVTVRTLPTEASRAAREAIRGPMPTATDATLAVEVDAYASTAWKTKPKSTKQAPSLDASVVRQSQGGLLVALTPDPQKGLVEASRATLAPDAWGLAVTHDGTRAIVTSAWAHTISIVDVTDSAALKVIATRDVPREPRGVVVLPDDKTAYVSHLVGSALSRIDDLEGAATVASAPLAAAPARGPAHVETQASNGFSLVLSPDGATLFAPRHAIGAEGIGSWWGAPTVDVLDVASGKSPTPVRALGSPTAAIEPQQSLMMPNPDWSAQPGLAPEAFIGLTQPRAAVYRKASDSLWIASEGSDTVTELSALAPDPSQAILGAIDLAGARREGDHDEPIGGGPAALALTKDESALLVFCHTTFDLVRIDLATKKKTWLHLADDGLTEAARRGRRLFANARVDGLSGGLGCASCHPEGRDDGYVWREATFGDGDRFLGVRENLRNPNFMSQAFDPASVKLHPRQTPMIAGRLRANGPYGWHGANKDLLDRLVEGTSLHRGAWSSRGLDASNGMDVTTIDYLVEFVRSGLMPPPTLDRELTADEMAGKALFESPRTGCATCHAPSREFTDRSVPTLTALPTRAGLDTEDTQSWKTPSLWFVGGTAPYLHDGSAATLEDLLRTNGDRMGHSSLLKADEQSQLAAYLRTL